MSTAIPIGQVPAIFKFSTRCIQFMVYVYIAMFIYWSIKCISSYNVIQSGGERRSWEDGGGRRKGGTVARGQLELQMI